MKNIIYLLAIIGTSTFAWADQSQKLHEIIDEIYAYNLTQYPTMAQRAGNNNSADQLTDMSPAALTKRAQQNQTFVDALQAIDVGQLTRTDQINHIMQLRNVQYEVDKVALQSQIMPINSDSGFHSNLLFTRRAYQFNNIQDFYDYLGRLQSVPTYFDQHIVWMRKGIELGRIQPLAPMKGIDTQVKAFIKDDPTKSPFYQPFEQLSHLGLTADEESALRDEAALTISESVFTAYRKLHRFLVKEYLPAAPVNIAITDQYKGAEYYQNQIRYYTTTDLSADEIHSIGLAEVKRIRNEMQQIVDHLEFDGDINAFIQFLRTDPQFYARSEEQLIKEAAYISKQMDARLPQLFHYWNLPRTPYGVEPVPASIAPKYTTGRYIGASADDKPGYYWVNTYALDKRPLYALPALTLHEAVPGHHLQNAMAREMEGLPEFRTSTYISAFGEGWGLYSEYLGKEVGIYKTPYEDFGRLSYEMWRACRLVVDTGMHTKGWSRQKAIDYMLENTALSELNVRTEVDRYITWPAQALSYKLGEIKIRALREHSQQMLGEAFDLRDFHHAVLKHGSVPLFVLEDNIDNYIEEQSNKQHKQPSP